MEATNPERARNPLLRALDTGLREGRVEAFRDVLLARLRQNRATTSGGPLLFDFP
ncbi:MAG: hypothetical protein RL199_552 [Pseudomonadota bacterium]|jgi:hypothetical protein